MKPTNTRISSQRYVMALLLLGVTVIGSFLVHRSMEEHHELDSSLLSASGRQRTLVARVALHLHLVGSRGHTCETVSCWEQVEGALAEMRDNHRLLMKSALASHGSDSLCVRLRNFYLVPPAALDSRTLEFTNKAEALAKQLRLAPLLHQREITELALMAERLLEYCDEAFGLREKMANSFDVLASRVTLGLFTGNIAVLIIVWFMLFRPMINRIRTQLKALEESGKELALSEERLNHAIRLSSDGLWDLHIPSNKVFYSKRWCEALGYQPDEAGDDLAFWQSIVHPDDSSEVMRAVEEHFSGNTDGYEVENRLRKKSGEYRFNLERGKVVEWDDSGSPIRMIGVDVDITERKQVEKIQSVLFQISEATSVSNNLAELLGTIHQQLGTLVDCTNFFVALYDDTTELYSFPYCVDAVDKLEDITPQQLKKSLTDYVRRTGRPLLLDEQGHKDLIKTGEVALVGNHAKIWLGTPLKTVEGIIGVVVIQSYTNPTAITQADVELVSFVSEHIAVAIERKRFEDELQETKEAAEAANRAKGDFLANMSHEIRTPMNGIIGFSDLLADEALTEDQAEYVETIQSSAAHLLSVVNDILDFSKVDAGMLDLETLDFDLQTTLDSVVDLLALKAEAKNLVLTCDVDPEMPTLVNGDPGRLRQILTNLVNNAIKFTENGNVAITANMESESDRHLCFRFTITDTGVGIPEEALAALFQSFTQADSSMTRKFGGTGLGLAICKQLVDMMDGEIGVESQLGKGSSFWFNIRLKKQRQSRQPKAAFDTEIAGKRALIVDDSETHRKVLKQQLKAYNLQVEDVASGEIALKLLRDESKAGKAFDVAILDMQIPEMDGVALGKAIANDASIKDTVLIMLTSVGQRGDAKKLYGAGFQAYLTKPIRQGNLLDCLRTALGAAQTESKKPPLITQYTLAENQKKSASVLVVEDNVVNRKVAAKMLEKMGYSVDCAVNGKEAVAAVATASYDLVLMDCQMPEMDGFEATGEIRRAESQNRRAKGEESGANSEGRRAKRVERTAKGEGRREWSEQRRAKGEESGANSEGRRVKRVERGARIPIIAMTANAMQGDRERCLAAGMDDYISKPVNAKKLEEAIHKWTKPRVNVVEDIEAPLPTRANL